MPYEAQSPPLPPLLRLPLELRQQIYTYLLPYTSNVSKPSVSRPTNQVWIRGNIALLLVNRQINAECLDLLYGRNIFSISINYAAIRFDYSWLLPSGLAPSRPYSFLDHFSAQNILRIRRFKVDVLHVDDYTGMIKYNCSGRGLMDGLRGQVRRFVDAIEEGSGGGLHSLETRLNDGSGVLNQLRKHRVHVLEANRDVTRAQTVLEPFRALRGVRKLEISGAVTEGYVALCTRKMMDDPPLLSTEDVLQQQHEFRELQTDLEGLSIQLKTKETENASARCRCALNRRLEFQAEGTPGGLQVANIESIRRPCPVHHNSCDLFSRK